MKKALILLVAALFTVMATNVHAKDPNAAEAADRFYRAYLKLNPRGLPTEKEMETFNPLFSSELNELIGAARREQQKFIKEHPGEKPPWIEGNLFASNYEGVSEFKLGAPAFNGDKASIPVYLEYREDTHVARWIDVIILELANKEWRLSDIFMNAPWSFRSGPNLRSMLALE